MTQVKLTDTAMSDLQEIYNYSMSKRGESTADDYLEKFDHSLNIIRSNPSILKINKNISSRFRIYFVQKHCLICDMVGDTVVVLTILHTSMNLLERLKKLEPSLEEEVTILSNRLRD